MAAISGSRHKFQRSVCASAFKREALRSYVPVLQELTMKHLGAWADASKGLRDPEPEIQLYTFEVAEKILLGTSNSNDDLLSILDTFKVWLAAYQGLVPWNVWWTAHGQGMKARATLTKYYQTVIDRKRKNPLPDASDMLTNVMNECDRGEPMTDDELKDFCLVMMFAGHDTTKCTLQTMLHYLSANPKVAKELEDAVSQVWDGKSPITMEMVENLQTGKLGRFNDEILRLKPAVAAVYRVAQEDIEYQGITIPKGWKLMSSPIVQNMQVSPNQDIDLSIDHAKFREDQYSPFGGGSRKCIGYSFAKLELIVWTMCTLKHFDVKVEEGKAAEVNVPFIFIKVRSEFVRKHA
jgi:cytochrome P450